MLPKTILKVIGEPGTNTIVILDALFREKKRKSLHVVYDDDIRAYCIKHMDKVKLSPAAAVSETQVLKWYGVVKVSNRGKKLIIEKDKLFDKMAKLAKQKPKKVIKKPSKPTTPKAKSFESIFDSFLIKPKAKSKKPIAKKRGKNGKPRVHILQNSKKRNTKQKNSRGRKVSRVSGHTTSSKRPRTRNTKKPLRNISGHARKRSKRAVRPKPKARKKLKRKTKR
tara:strand:- start:8425 stop:9096 length:672 start_codon:yes stop_codon:yes gene_type:complete